MDAFQEGGYTLRDLLQVVLRNRFKVLLFLTAVALATGVGLLFAPRSYESEARLLVRSSAEAVTVDSGASITPSATGRQEDLNTIVELLASRTILEQVVQKLGAHRILNAELESAAEESDSTMSDRTTPPALGKVGQTGESIGVALLDSQQKLGTWLNPADLTEKAVDCLQKSVDVFSPEKSNLIVVTAECSSPELARQVVASLVDTYRHFHDELHSASQSVEFLSIQADELGSQLGDARQRIRDFKTEIGVVSIQSRQESLQEYINTVKSDVLKAKADLAASQGRMTALARGAELFPERIKTTETNGAAEKMTAAETMRSQMFTLEIQAAALRAKYTAEHAEVKAIEKQITDISAILAKEKNVANAESVVTSTDVNPMYQEWLLDTLQEDAAGRAASEQLKILEEQETSLVAEVAQLNQYEARMTDLQNEADTFSQRHLATLASLEQARLSQRLKEHEISDVVLVQEATLQRRPVSPNVPMLLAIASVIAICGSLALAMFCDLLDGSLRTEAELERALKVPILATIPRVARRHSIIKYDRSNRGALRSGNYRRQTTDSAAVRQAENVPARG